MIRVLVLGGGFAGIRTALDLDRLLPGGVEITLIDRNAYHLFVPALYEVASAFEEGKDPFQVKLRRSVAIPYGDIFEGRNINFIQAEIETADLQEQKVTTKGGHALVYDYLVLALGSQPTDFGIPGVQEYAFQFRTLDDALLINRKIKERLNLKIQEKISSPIRVLIAGAGFTGIELAAELASFVHRLEKTISIPGKGALIYLFEAGNSILPMIQDGQRQIIRKRLTRLGIAIMERSHIIKAEENKITLQDGRVIEGDVVIWTAGQKANVFLQSIKDLELAPDGKIITGEHLHLANHKNVFAAGDNIQFMDHATNKPIPSLAYLAIDHGKVIARNIFKAMRGEEYLIHRPFYNQWIAPVGSKYAVTFLGQGIVFRGFLGWVIRGLVDLRYFISILPLRKAIKFFLSQEALFIKND